MNPKVLVGCPTGEPKGYCLQQYVDATKTLTYQPFDVLLVDNSSTTAYRDRIEALGIPVLKDTSAGNLFDKITRSRNKLREWFLSKDYEYFLSLEQDVIPPKDVIERLLSHNKPIVSGIYYTLYKMQGEMKTRPVAWAPVEGQADKMRFITTEALAGSKGQPLLLELKACGLGCILIHRSVMEKLQFRVPADYSTYDDIPFCEDAIKAGFKVYADTGVQCEHLVFDALQ